MSVEQVTRLYGGTAALRGVSARFEAGRAHVIEGANGSGKSTLLSLLATATRPTTGRVTWEPLGDDPAEARRHVGWLGHEALVYPDLSGLENLRWAAKLYGLGDDAVDEVTARLAIGGWKTRRVRTYSRGQRQRVALARALLHRPTLLLLDEPATGLDRDGVAKLEAIVREEVARGSVVVCIAHEPTFATALDADVLRLAAGRVANGVASDRS